MKIMIINGPNINMLGIREPSIYGSVTYDDLCNRIMHYCKTKNIDVTIKQSNHEGDLVDFIQSCHFQKYNGIIINPGAYTHTSIAILDALKSVMLPTVEVHISDISLREEYRKHSYVSEYTKLSVIGKGIDGYLIAIDQLIKIL